jgi:endonuclease/exonuclease/phosphatase family metal-dependent hydrolase
MKKIILGLFIFAALFISAPVFADDAANASDSFDISVLTFNIRLSTGEIGQPEEWKNRRPGAVELIKRGDYDFVGIQEAILHPTREELSQVGNLKADLPGYGMVFRSRDVSAERGEGTPLMYNKSRWMLDESECGVFWLSLTPDKPGSKLFDAECPRTVCWGRFIRLENGKPTDKAVYFYNTHLDHVGTKARVEGAMILADFIAKRKHDDPVFVTGDMNCPKDSPAMLYLAGAKITSTDPNKKIEIQSPVPLIDVHAVLHPNTDEQTYHDWGKGHYNKRIDFIWASPCFKPVSSRVIKEKVNGLFLSDHHPVEATVKY